MNTLQASLNELLADNERPITAVVDVIRAAIQPRASDIHLEPTGKALDVFFRVDGVLQSVASLPVSPREKRALMSRFESCRRSNDRRPWDRETQNRIPNQSFVGQVDASPNSHLPFPPLPILP